MEALDLKKFLNVLATINERAQNEISTSFFKSISKEQLTVNLRFWPPTNSNTVLPALETNIVKVDDA